MTELLKIENLVPPVLPEGGHLEELNDPFLLGKIAALFCSLRYDATHKIYNDAAVLKLAITSPSRFVKQIGIDALKYARILGPGLRSKKLQEIQALETQLSDEFYEPTRMNQQEEACIALGFFKQNDYMIKEKLVRDQKKYNSLIQKSELTDTEQSTLQRLTIKFFPEG